MPSFLFSNSIYSTHIWAKRFRNEDGAVGLLVVFDDGEPGAAHGKPAAIDGMHKLGLGGLAGLSGGGPVANIGAARLKGFEVGTGRDFAVEVLARKPDFEVIGFG